MLTLIRGWRSQGDKQEARAFLVRLLQMAVGFGSLLAAALFLGSPQLPRLFTEEANVVAMAQRVLPFVALVLVRP